MGSGLGVGVPVGLGVVDADADAEALADGVGEGVLLAVGGGLQLHSVVAAFAGVDVAPSVTKPPMTAAKTPTCTVVRRTNRICCSIPSLPAPPTDRLTQ